MKQKFIVIVTKKVQVALYCEKLDDNDDDNDIQ
jgi:hypothetical protein